MSLTKKENSLYHKGKELSSLYRKKDADPNLIKNWRPLTLLNCDDCIKGHSTLNQQSFRNLDQKISQVSLKTDASVTI